MKICKVKDCFKKSKAHGFCSMHNHRNNRHGDPLGGTKFRDRNPPKKCTIPDCNHKYLCNGLCRLHYERFRRHGDPIKTVRNTPGNGHVSKQGYRGHRINTKYFQEHRLIMEKHLGRKLLPFPQEVVHHIDGNRLNNDISNLQVMSGSEHTKLHLKIRYAKKY
jgi:hypothetical protein